MSSVLSQRTACKQGKGGGQTRSPERVYPLSSVRSQRTACRNGGGVTPQTEGEGATPPKQARMPLDLSSPPPHRETK